MKLDPKLVQFFIEHEDSIVSLMEKQRTDYYNYGGRLGRTIINFHTLENVWSFT